MYIHRHNTSLEELNLRENTIGDEGAAVFSESLRCVDLGKKLLLQGRLGSGSRRCDDRSSAHLWQTGVVCLGVAETVQR